MRSINFIVIAHNIRSLYNVGSIFRACDAAGIDKLYLGGYTGGPDDSQIKKTALGAQSTVAWEKFWQTYRLIDILKKQGYQIVALEKTNKSIHYLKYKPKFPIALILGNEKRGVSDKILIKCDKIVHLPMKGKKESLNVSVAFGIMAYKLLEYK